MKHQDQDLQQLFEEARQQQRFTSLPEVQKQLAAAIGVAAAAGTAAAAGQSAMAANGVAVTKAGIFTSQAIAMISTAITTLIIGSGLWYQHEYVQTQHQQAGSAQSTAAEIPFKYAPAAEQHSSGTGPSAAGAGTLPLAAGARALQSAAAAAVRPEPGHAAEANPGPTAGGDDGTGTSWSAAPGDRPFQDKARDKSQGKQKDKRRSKEKQKGKVRNDSPDFAAGAPTVFNGNVTYIRYPSIDQDIKAIIIEPREKALQLVKKPVDPARYVRLQPQDLEKLGIRLTERYLEYNNFVSANQGKGAGNQPAGPGEKEICTLLNVHLLGKEKVALEVKKSETVRPVQSYPLFITEGNGVQRVMYKLLHEYDDKLTQQFFDAREPLLVPVLVESKHGIDGKVVFWFMPCEPFLALLPEATGKEVRARYRDVLQAQHNPVAARKAAEAKAALKSDLSEKASLSSLESATVFPNPARHAFTLTARFVKPDFVRVQLLDLKGRLVKELQSGLQVPAGSWSRSFQLQELSEGTYLVQLRSESGEQWSQRLVVE